MKNFKNTKILKTKLIKRLNLNIYKIILKIFPKIKLKIKGFSKVLILKKKYILLYLKILKNTSSFLFNNLVDISIIDYP